MSVNSHLTAVADANIIRDSKKDGIKRSVDTIKERLDEYFDSDISDKFVFGSYSRGTILPREYDENSDVDLMVVFDDDSLAPQTYLNKLKEFAEERYSTSIVSQSSPAVVLELNHIKFELVPAIKNEWTSGYKIPDKASSYNDWISTDPTAFNTDLSNANQKNGSRIKPLIRVIKYWNAFQDHPRPSFSIEEAIVSRYRYGTAGFQNLEDYFMDFVKGWNIDFSWPKGAREKVERLKEVVEKVDLLESEGDEDSAETELKKVIPAPIVDNATSNAMSRVAYLNTSSKSPFDVSHRQPPKWAMRLSGTVAVQGRWSRDGFRTIELTGKPYTSPYLEKHGDLFYEARTNVQKPFEVFWQVVNTGNEAASQNCLRGEFNDGDANLYGLRRKEATAYTGMHWVECFIVKNDVCVARSGEFAINIK